MIGENVISPFVSLAHFSYILGEIVMLHILRNLNIFMSFESMTLYLRSKIKTLLKNKIHF